ncbi:unnamed protein product [Linum trigynum]|uniref:Uncharacterized protein n=1 Tax=Linum trigynum TaxID=586398 RepID=A0AAV2FL10_9ROSI
MGFRRPRNYENAIRKYIGPNRCLTDLSSVENRINRLHYQWRIARPDSVICSLQNRKKMAFRINCPKSEMLAFWNLPKIDPENIRPNRCLMDSIIVADLPQAESVICSLQYPKKMAFRRPRNYENAIRK